MSLSYTTSSNSASDSNDTIRDLLDSPPENPTDSQLCILHEHAEALFTEKMSHLKNFIFPLKNKPTLYDLYTNEKKFELPEIPSDIQMDFYFSNFPYIVNMWSKTAVQDSSQPIELSRVIWHYALDPNHSFHDFWQGTRLNLILMSVFYLAREYEDPNGWFGENTPEHFKFATECLQAWLSFKRPQIGHVDWRDEFIDFWKTAGCDMTVFKSSQKTKLEKGMQHLKAAIFPHHLSGDVEELMGSDAITNEDFSKYGPALALKWYITHGKRMDEDKNEEYLDTMMGGIGVDTQEITIEVLRKVNWRSRLMDALLVDVHETEKREIVRSDEDHWLDGKRAVEILGTREATDTLKALFESLSLA
ncbi:hypothetical protein P154DRAFT_584640 [Amniculicola lignicola CBS 123094]|uniref:Uncharacterized protein n=1 Tax=Amniculicola lignicola CBS 123094 TaxID=1392246 RepID=A0A6A5X5B9_9PLEO|nr:hypothetical protein P154DRAFT_584640 [Amniculicola lignicola CBS 123094]